MMQWNDDAPRPDFDPFSDHGNSYARDRRVGVEVAKLMKVALRRPDRGKALLIGELRPFNQEFVAIGGGGRAVVGK